MSVDWGKVGALAGFVGAIATVLQIVLRPGHDDKRSRTATEGGLRLDRQDRAQKQAGPARVALPAVMAIAGVIVLVAVFYKFTPESPPQSQGPTFQPGSTGPAPTTTTPPPLKPSPPINEMRAQLAIKKSAFFKGSLPLNQFQAKFQLYIKNVSAGSLNAKIANIRLLIPGDEMPGVWTPRVPTADLSVVTLDDGKHYVAIPANQNKDCEPVNSPCTTFASFWYPPDPLTPGGWYEGQGLNSGDVVYYVPDVPGIYLHGIALISDDGGSVLGYQEINQSDGKDHPRDF